MEDGVDKSVVLVPCAGSVRVSCCFFFLVEGFADWLVLHVVRFWFSIRICVDVVVGEVWHWWSFSFAGVFHDVCYLVYLVLVDVDKCSTDLIGGCLAKVFFHNTFVVCGEVPFVVCSGLVVCGIHPLTLGSFVHPLSLGGFWCRREDVFCSDRVSVYG